MRRTGANCKAQAAAIRITAAESHRDSGVFAGGSSAAIGDRGLVRAHGRDCHPRRRAGELTIVDNEFEDVLTPYKRSER